MEVGTLEAEPIWLPFCRLVTGQRAPGWFGAEAVILRCAAESECRVPYPAISGLVAWRCSSELGRLLCRVADCLNRS